MKKIKLTESQIKMIQEHEKSLGKKKVLKITKEHYDALFSTLNESSEVTNNFKKYGKDLGVKYESHPAEGSYKPQSEEENEKTHTSFNESISEDISSMLDLTTFTSEFISAIKQFISDPSQEGLSPFWLKIGVTWGDLKALLIYFGIMTTTVIGGNEVLVRVKSKEKVLKGIRFLGRHLWNMLAKKKRYDMKNNGAIIQDEGLTEWGDGGYPAGAEYDSNAPFNQNDDEVEPLENETPFDLITYNDSIAILKKYKEPLFFIFDIEGETKYWDTNSDDDITNHINELYASGDLMDYMEPLTLDGIAQIESKFQLNIYFKKKLEKIKQILMDNGGVGENTTTASVGGAYVTPKIWANSKKDMKFAKDPMIKGGKILKQDVSEIEGVKYKRFVGEMDMYLNASSLEDAEKMGERIAKLLNRKFETDKDGKFSGSYARFTNIKELNFGQRNIGESIEERTGQVTFDDCVKLDNNKEAQNGGCSVGAVDNVVKVDETVLETVAKQTGKSISEVRDIILKHKTKNNG